MKREWFALSVVLVVLVLFPAGLFGYQAWRSRAPGMQVINIVARLPEEGGFTPDQLRLVAGEPVRLRLTSPAVVHGLTIPGLGIDIEAIEPGKVVTVDFTPAAPGRYAFACTRWCGIDHWRMRGVIEVVAAPGMAEDDGVVTPTTEAPLYQRLGLDLDAAMSHEAHALPEVRPSAARGAALGVSLPTYLLAADERRALSPTDAFARLRADPALADLHDGDLWDLVAWAWLRETTPVALARAESLYARDCAACHGPEGRGDGPAGRALPGLQKMDPAMPAGPADFTNAAQMLSANDAMLQGKMLRGGMGTGMPEFGSLYTDDELWAMVTYVRGFLLGR
jgi:mono/diheme cytochrome c family protein